MAYELNTPISIKESSFKSNLTVFFNTGLSQNLPFAIWKKPSDEKIEACLRLSNTNTMIEELEYAPKGFIFHPFETSENKKRQYIKSDVSFDSIGNEIKLDPNYHESSQTFNQFISSYTTFKKTAFFDFRSFLTTTPKVKPDKKEFIALVNKCKQTIGKGHYQKIVPSRRKVHHPNNHFHPITEFFKLCKTYQNAFVSIVYIPNHGLWMGATPELLMAVEGKKKFSTTSLAGTQPYYPERDLSQVAWMQKEIEEQALVSRYIVNCFKQIRLREFKENGPKTVQAGNVLHLKSVFEVDIEEVSHPKLGSSMLQLLHPTSAVCGMPMLPSAKFLRENEGYDRDFYSGYLGPVNYNESTNIFVNLRCGRIYKDGLLLFAGAGVSEDSNPEKEWQETNMKFDTLLNVIKN